MSATQHSTIPLVVNMTTLRGITTKIVVARRTSSRVERVVVFMVLQHVQTAACPSRVPNI